MRWLGAESREMAYEKVESVKKLRGEASVWPMRSGSQSNGHRALRRASKGLSTLKRL